MNRDMLCYYAQPMAMSKQAAWLMHLSCGHHVYGPAMTNDTLSFRRKRDCVDCANGAPVRRIPATGPAHVCGENGVMR